MLTVQKKKVLSVGKEFVFRQRGLIGNFQTHKYADDSGVLMPWPAQTEKKLETDVFLIIYKSKLQLFLTAGETPVHFDN